ncbi:MAG: PQQ-binding-like beta-propeller repeat protein [Planctomycetota bacterium]
MPAVARTQIFVLIFCYLAACEPTSAENWPSIRGPHFDGSSAKPVEFSSTQPIQLNVAWKRSIGSGYSGVVKQGKVLVTAMAEVESNQEFVLAIDSDSGDEIWRTVTGPVFKGANGSFDGPVATPAVDSTAAYHLSPHGRFAAYDLLTGKMIWEHDFVEEFKPVPNFYGFGASPIVYQDKVIVGVGAPDAAIVAFDAGTGNVIWKAGEDSVAFQSGVPIKVGDDEQIVIAGNQKMFGIDPQTGDVRWTRQHEGSGAMGSWTVQPVPLPGGGIFVNDGESTSSGVGIEGSATTTNWNGRDIRNTYCVPVVAGGVLCSYSSRFLVGVDPLTGDRLFRSRKPSNGFMAKLGESLVIATMDGELHIGSVTTTGFDEVAATDVFKPDVDGQLWSLPTVAGKSIYLRSLGAIARIDLQTGDQPKQTPFELIDVGVSFAKVFSNALRSDDPNQIIEDYVSAKGSPVVEDGFVHFVAKSDFDDIAVASDIFGMRQERPMKRIGKSDWFYHASPKPEVGRISYVFFADYKPQLDPFNDQVVTSTTISGEMEPVFRGPAPPLKQNYVDLSTDTTAGEEPPVEMLGTLQASSLLSDSLDKEVKMKIYLPPQYSVQPDRRFPVIYCHDGSAAVESGDQAAIVDRLINAKKIEPAIVVFIDQRFYPMMGAEGYSQMFGEDLIPMIDTAYRTMPSREYRSSLGGGFGGTLALMATMPNSDKVAKLGMHVPFAFEFLHPALSMLIASSPEKISVNIEWGTLEMRNPSENWNMGIQAKKVSEMFEANGHQVKAEEVPIATDWVCWRTRSEEMYSFFTTDP